MLKADIRKISIWMIGNTSVLTIYFQVNIFNLSEADTKDIDRAILYALLKGKHIFIVA